VKIRGESRSSLVTVPEAFFCWMLTLKAGFSPQISQMSADEV
jgi:hypothetical protein